MAQALATLIENESVNQKEKGEQALNVMRQIEESVIGKCYEFSVKGVTVRCKTKERFEEYKKLLLNDKKIK